MNIYVYQHHHHINSFLNNSVITIEPPANIELQNENLNHYQQYLKTRKSSLKELSPAKKKSLSYKFSKIDYEKQCRTIQEMKAINPNRKNYGDPQSNDIDFQVYTLPYKCKIKADAKLLTVQFSTDTYIEQDDEFRKVHHKKHSKNSNQNKQQEVLQYDPNDFYGDDGIIPQLPRLLFLHQKYCAGQSQKTVEDLQKDLFCVNDDLRNLELYLKGEKIAFWTTIEDYVLKKHAFDIHSPEYQFLVKQKGPDEVQKRRDFLGL